MKLSRFLIAIVMIISSVFAGVNLKNGNFYITYTDIVVPGGGHDLVIERTYNSRSIDKGWFGYGWGSDYETYLSVSADGSVIVHENGSGALTRFTPKTAVNAEEAAKKIVDAMRKSSMKINSSVAKDLVAKLKNDAELRQAYAKRFKVEAKLASGTKLFSNVRGLQTLEVTSKGYIRSQSDGAKHHFNKEGKLVKVQHKNGYYVDLTYKNGKLTKIKDSMAKQIFLSWYPDGKIKSVESGAGNKTLYKYDDKDNLIEAKDVQNNLFAYSYDYNHNMTQIKYKDGSTMKIKYTKRTQFVEEIVNKNGEVVSYKYESNPKNPENHYWTLVGKKLPSGKEVTNRYEYEIRRKQDGSSYTHRIYTVVNGVSTETIYTECCGLPKQIKRGKNVTNFEYNKKGLLTKKFSSRGDFVELEYDKVHNKITKVTNKSGWTNFEYDKKGNLKKAQDSKGKSVLLIYDSKGRIAKMLDYDKSTKKKRQLEFKYNAQGKPTEIAMNKVGKINVKYDNYGEIQKVESKSGHKMALQVTQAFQSLLAIVKPAGVNLNM